MSNMFYRDGRWVSADEIRRKRAEAKKVEVKPVKALTEVQQARLDYKEANPSGKGVSPKYINDIKYMKSKTLEFTN